MYVFSIMHVIGFSLTFIRIALTPTPLPKLGRGAFAPPHPAICDATPVHDQNCLSGIIAPNRGI